MSSPPKPTVPTQSPTATTTTTSSQQLQHLGHKAPSASHNLPFWKTFVAGGTAGIIEILVMYPTDVMKTRAQLSTTANKNMFVTMYEVVRTEGIGALYRGIASPILAEAPKRAVKFATNEKYKEMLARPDGSLPPQRAFLAGAMAGATEVIVNCPFEVIKVRMQAKNSPYKSTLDCAIQTLKSEGIVGLYRGAEPQLWRNAAWNGTYFGLIGTIRQKLPTPADATHNQIMLYNFITGAIAGTAGSILNTPFDVVKSRMQNQKYLPGQPLKYKWTFPALITVYREEGVRALYKGLGPRLVRLGPGGGIMLVAFDKIAELLKRF